MKFFRILYFMGRGGLSLILAAGHILELIFWRPKR